MSKKFPRQGGFPPCGGGKICPYIHIYFLRNVLNGKGYVGQTNAGVYRRKKMHRKNANRARRSRLYSAIRRYGFGNFQIYVLTHARTSQEAGMLETYWIKHHTSESKWKIAFKHHLSYSKRKCLDSLMGEAA